MCSAICTAFYGHCAAAAVIATNWRAYGHLFLGRIIESAATGSQYWLRCLSYADTCKAATGSALLVGGIKDTLEKLKCMAAIAFVGVHRHICFSA